MDQDECRRSWGNARRTSIVPTSVGQSATAVSSLLHVSSKYPRRAVKGESCDDAPRSKKDTYGMQSHQIDANASGGQDDENAGNGVQVEEQEQKEEEQAPLVQLQERMRKVASCVRKIPSYKTVRAQQELLSAEDVRILLLSMAKAGFTFPNRNNR